MAVRRAHFARRLFVGTLAVMTLAGQLLQAERAPRAPAFSMALRDARVIEVDPLGPAERAGMRAGDVIEQVAGLAVPPGGRALPLLGRFAAGDTVALVVRRGVTRQAIDLPLSLATQRDVIWRFTLAAVGMFTLLTGLLVYLKKPRDLTLIFAGICYGLAYIIHPPLMPSGPWLHWLGELLLTSLTFLVPPLFIHFFLLFPMRRPWIEVRGHAPLLYLPSMVLLVLSQAWHAGGLPAGPGVRRLLVDLAETGAVLVWLAGIGGAIWLFIDSYRRARTDTARRQIRVVLWATILGALPMILVLPIRQIWPQQPFPADRLAVLSTILIPLGFGYAIVRHGVFDATLLVRRSFALTVLVAALVLVYLAISLFLRMLFHGSPSGPPMWASFVATGAVALLFLPAQQRIRALLVGMSAGERPDERTVLYEFGQALRGVQDRPAVVRATSEFLAEALGVERVAFCEPSEGGQLEMVYLYGVSPDGLARHRFSPSLSRRILQLAAPLERGDLETDLPYGYISPSDQAGLAAVDAEILVPIRATGAMGGVLLAGRRMLGDPIGPDDLRLAATIAAESAIALENAGLHARARAEARLRDEVQDARELQQRMMPAQMPQVESLEISGFSIPCEAVGGDYYDCFRTAWGEIAFVIGDVSGKGVPGALLMANLAGLLKTEARRRESPAQTVERINRRLCEMRRPERFITFCLARIDPLTGGLTYCNAGHAGCFVIRADGHAEEMIAGGLPLGIRPQANYQEGRLSLRSGDLLLLYTDGITERRNGEDEFGSERLHTLVARGRRRSARALQESILSAVHSHAPGPLEDDTTLLVVKVL